jgi:protocatechuate 3,4-dioxygenase beta subunit
MVCCSSSGQCSSASRYRHVRDHYVAPIDLNLIEQAARRETLLARREERQGQPVYRFDLRLQGEQETVFLDV